LDAGRLLILFVSPRVKESRDRILEIGGVSRYERQAGYKSRGRYEAIHEADRPAQRCARRDHFPPHLGNRFVDRQNSSGETNFDIAVQPAFKLCAPLARFAPLNPETYFRERNRTQESPILID
jgi:hypothetical protein